MTDSLAKLGDTIDAFVAERDWAQFHTPKNLAMSVAIEAAELMEHFQWGTDADSAALDPAQRKLVAQEMGDVLIYLVRLSRILDIDLVAAAAAKLELNRVKYPIEKAKGRATKYVDLE
jgi:dCTP diphosphatase